MRGVHLTCLAAIVAAGCASQPAPAPVFPGGDLIDLTHSLGSDTIFWPTAARFELAKVADGVTDKGYYYAANSFRTEEHGGTHVDAPIHFGAGRQTVDAIPLERLVARAVVVDVSERAARDRDYQVTVDDFGRFEQDHGPIEPNTIVLIRTGFSARWPDAEQYLGTTERGPQAVPLLHFPRLHPDAARWLIDNRQPAAVGIDTASIDYGQSTMFETHRFLSDQNIPGFENLTALERLPATGAFVIALPMKIAGGSGGPIRAIAIVPPPD